MRMYIRVGVLLAAAACLILASTASGEADKPKAAADKITAVGRLSTTEDDDWNITSAKLTTDAGVVYNITLDEKGKALANEMSGAKVEVVGTVREISRAKWLTVISYKEVQEAEAPDPPRYGVPTLRWRVRRPANVRGPLVVGQALSLQASRGRRKRSRHAAPGSTTGYERCRRDSQVVVTGPARRRARKGAMGMDVRKTVWMIAAMVLGLIFAGSLEAARKPTRSGTTDTEKKSTWYIVVQVKDTKGEVSFEVIDAKNLTTRVKACREQYKEAVKEWNAARTTAKKNKQTFTTKKPVEPYVRQVGSRFKSEAKAKEYAEKLRQLYEARKAKKAAKSTEPKNTAPAPDTNKEEE